MGEGIWFPSVMRAVTGYVWILLALAWVPVALAGGDKKEVARVSFHIETEATDNPKMIFPHDLYGQRKYFRRIPEVSSRDFVAFTPFPAEDQGSYGLVFQMKDPARRRLAAITAVNTGRWLVCQAFGRIVDGVMIDKAVDDGAVVVWQGISIEEVRLLDESLPRIGEGKKK